MVSLIERKKLTKTKYDNLRQKRRQQGRTRKKIYKNRKKCLTKERREGIIKKLTAPATKVIEKRIETYHKTWKNQKFRQKSEPE